MARLKLYSAGDKKRELILEPKPGFGDEEYRSDWRRDYARVIHCPAFRRLQGKTQLFYGNESVVRNRLTHSLEVAQIAKAIAFKVRAEFGLPVEPDIVEIAGLVHDMGHPPFGHNGEKALNEQMIDHGGFEGNAQTLRILTKLEKKQKAEGSSKDGFDSDGNDVRYGLNLTYRVIASALKYDAEIPKIGSSVKGLNKGYYFTEAEVVERTKKNVLGKRYKDLEGQFKTVECAIMDIADDIAYSTYNLEDAFKAGFINPLQLISAPKEDFTTLEKIREKVNKKLQTNFKLPDIMATLMVLLAGELQPSLEALVTNLQNQDDVDFSDSGYWLIGSAIAFQDAQDLASNGYRRIRFTSSLVERFIRGVRVDVNEKVPALSKVYLDPIIERYVEVLKQFAYFSIIESPRLKVPEHRGHEIVQGIFEKMVEPDGQYLLPDDFQRIHRQLNETGQRRLVSDFIAGMTDQYALRLYNRLYSDVPTTLFGPS